MASPKNKTPTICCNALPSVIPKLSPISGSAGRTASIDNAPSDVVSATSATNSISLDVFLAGMSGHPHGKAVNWADVARNIILGHNINKTHFSEVTYEKT